MHSHPPAAAYSATHAGQSGVVMLFGRSGVVMLPKQYSTAASPHIMQPSGIRGSSSQSSSAMHSHPPAAAYSATHAGQSGVVMLFGASGVVIFLGRSVPSTNGNTTAITRSVMHS